MAKASSIQKNNLRYKLIKKFSNKRKFLKSRIKIRELSMTGDLPGVVKSSW